MNYFIGIDVGTSGTKTVLFDETGNVVSSSSVEYQLVQPQNGWAEQCPKDWKKAVINSLKDLVNKVNSADIRGIGVSGQMHGLVVLDKQNIPLCNSIIWCDQRTEKEVAQIVDAIGKEKYISLTLNAPNTSFTLSKLLWVKNNWTEIYKKINKILLPKDYINFCLTGKFATDVSDASGTGYFDVKNREWCEEILSSFQIQKEWLPKVFESCQAVGNITKEISALTGLSESTIVVAGAGDQAAAALGNGIIHEGSASISLGTSGVAFSAVCHPVYDKLGRTHTFCHAVPNMWHVMGVTQGCGLSVNWFKENFADRYTYKQLDQFAENISSDGVVFLPYLMGERTPHLDPNCRASFTGISAKHNVFHFYRAVLEGTCMSIKDCVSVMDEMKIKMEKISVCGGGAKSSLWLQILAGVLEHNVMTKNNSESGALGVAMLASVGSNIYSSVHAASKKFSISVDRNIAFDSQKINYYKHIYATYKRLYHATNTL